MKHDREVALRAQREARIAEDRKPALTGNEAGDDQSKQKRKTRARKPKYTRV